MAEVLTKEIETGKDEILSVRPTMAYFYFDYALAVFKSLFFLLILYLIERFIRDFFGREDFYAPFWWSLAGGLYFLARAAVRHLKRNAACYTLTATALKVEDGILHRETRHILLADLRNVTVFAGLKQRLIGCGDVLIEHQQTPNGKIILRSVSMPKTVADRILRQMQTVQNRQVEQGYTVMAKAVGN